MAKITAEIMEGDEESDLESFIVKACGIDLRAFHKDRRILTRKIFETNFDKIMEVIEKRSSRRATYLVLGYFILFTGCFLPEDLKFKIIDASRWEHEKGSWDERFVRERKFYLKDFREKIRAHKPGVKLHLVYLKNVHDEDFSDGVIGLDQFWDCVESGRSKSIKHINLDSSNLAKIPTPIFDFTSLETLSLENNNIQTIPRLIRNLTLLKKLFLDGNQISTFPLEIVELESLEVLSLDNNQFKVIPPFVAKFRSLRELYLKNNFITETPTLLHDNKILIIL